LTAGLLKVGIFGVFGHRPLVVLVVFINVVLVVFIEAIYQLKPLDPWSN
jgi:hypothetical protein